VLGAFLDPIDEFDTSHELDDQAGTVDPAPVTLGFSTKLKDHRQGSVPSAVALRAPGAVTHRGEGRLYRIG